MMGDVFYWAAPIGTDDFEPACITYRDGIPDQVWFTGNEVPFDAKDCTIAEKIERKASSE